ncbi:integrase core domain-containing protein [Morganella psychrotolerans]
MLILLNRNNLYYIQLGKQQKNAYIGRFNWVMRHDWLNEAIFNHISEV